jgi:hypothetical protein
MTPVPEAADRNEADLERYLTDRVRQRPYSTLGAAAGIGYVLGGGLRSPLTATLVVMGARFFAEQLLRELGAVQRSSPITPVAAVPRSAQV